MKSRYKVLNVQWKPTSFITFCGQSRLLKYSVTVTVVPICNGEGLNKEREHLYSKSPLFTPHLQHGVVSTFLSPSLLYAV